MKSVYRRVAHILGVAAALSTPVAPAFSQSAYVLTLLNGLDGASSNIASAINNAGAVVGATTAFDSTSRQYTQTAWLLSPGSSVPLGLAPSLGYSARWFSDINNNGLVAGYNYDINLGNGPGNDVFTWSPSKGLRALATPASAYSSAVIRINDAGDSVGFVENSPLAYSAVAWDAAGNASTLPATPTGPATFGNFLNNNGQMLVTGAQGTTSRDYLWDSRTGYTALADVPGFSQSQGVALNDAGHGVGFASNDLLSLSGHATFWSDPRHVIDLGVLPGDAASLAYSVNASDMVVGVSSDTLFGEHTRGFLWSASTGMVDLLSLLDPHEPLLSQISILRAFDINDAGQIVGSLYLDGLQRAFVMTPVPEPASWVLLIAGIASLCGRVRRR